MLAIQTIFFQFRRKRGTTLFIRFQNFHDTVTETGSAAEKFANENNLQFIDPSAYTNLGGADMTLDFSTDVWSFGNSSSVFGSEYYLTEEARTQVVEQWLPNDAAMLDRAWSGSCFGLSATVVLAKAGLLPFAQLQPDAASLHDIEPTDEVLSLINYYHHLQFDNDYLTANGVFPKELLANFIKTKRAECAELAKIPNPAEFDRYYNL